MRILGIDPGTATVGYGVIEIKKTKPVFIDAGVISTPKILSDGKRLQLIEKDLDKLIKKFKPQIFALEKIYFSKNIKTAIGVAQARGVILLTAQKANLSVIECSPQDVKISVTGYGHAHKKQVQQMVKVLLDLESPPKPDDAADALAAAISVVNLVKFKQV